MTEIGAIEYDELEIAGELMLYNEKLTSVDCDFPALKNGENMFEGCTNLTTFRSNLQSLTHGNRMFYFCNSLSVFDCNLNSILDGTEMFSCTALTSFRSDLSSLTNGSQMFASCYQLTSFPPILSSLEIGRGMFSYCTNLASFDNNLFSLTGGGRMFAYCSNLASFSSDLSNLTTGDYMFAYCLNLTTFSSELSSLTDGISMFNNCKELSTFTSDLKSLENGVGMFEKCAKLTDFNSKLSHLTNGSQMFSGCSLSYSSLKNIIKSIPSVTGDDKRIDITVADSAKYEMGGDERFIGAEIPRFNDGRYFSLNHNGWELRLTSTSGFTVEVNEDMTFSIHVSKTYETTGNPNVSIGIAINSSSVKPGEQTTATISVTDFYKTNGQNKPSYQSVTISFDGSGKLTQDIPIQINQIGPVVIGGKQVSYKLVGTAYYTTDGEFDFSDLTFERAVVDDFNIVSGTKYIPDASNWNKEMYKPNSQMVKIVSVRGGDVYDETIIR